MGNSNLTLFEKRTMKSFATLLVLCLVAFAAALPKDRTVKVIGVDSGKPMDVSAFKYVENNKVQTWSHTKGLNQKFRMKYLTADTIQLFPLKNGNKLMVGESNGSLGLIPIDKRIAGFKMVKKGSAYLLKYQGICLDVAGWHKGNGGRITFWKCHGGKNQQWKIQNA